MTEKVDAIIVGGGPVVGLFKLNTLPAVQATANGVKTLVIFAGLLDCISALSIWMQTLRRW